jgi:predicted DCC family thiol-disulfide oxidoreductase YuxK
MTTDITGNRGDLQKQPWIIYDGNCGFCTAIINRMRGPMTRRGFVFLPFTSPAVFERLHSDPDASPDEMLVLTPTGKRFGGADAVIYLAGQVWWAWPIYLLGHVPGIYHLMRWGYRWIAAHRSCTAGACSIDVERK